MRTTQTVINFHLTCLTLILAA